MIIRDIVERPVAGPSRIGAPEPQKGAKGFPTASHRSARAARGTAASKPSGQSPLPSAGSTGLSRDEVDHNAQRVARMSVLERQEEVQELEQRFGARLMGMLKQRAERKVAVGPEVSQAEPVSADSFEASDSPPSSGQTVDAGPSRRRSIPSQAEIDKHFPQSTVETDKLAWTFPSSGPSDPGTIRFDLSGRPLSSRERAEIPASSGLHHHGDSPDLAGYTVDEILLLSRSSVTGQRVVMLDVLAKIIQRSDAKRLDSETLTVVGEASLRRRGFDAAVDVLLSQTSDVNVLRAAVNLLHQILRADQQETTRNGQLPFLPEDSSSVSINQLPLKALAARFVRLLAPASGFSSTQQRVLGIMQLAARSPASDDLPDIVVPIVRQNVVRSLWPLAIDEIDLPLSCLELAHDVIISSRRAAIDVAASGLHSPLLKFVAALFWPDPNPTTLSFTVLTLRIFYALGRYGLASAIVPSSLEIWRQLTQHLSQKVDEQIWPAFLECLTVWTTCATDPHQTTPEHDLTWSQIAQLDWVDEAIQAMQYGGERTQDSGLGFLCAWTIGLKRNEPSKLDEFVTRISKGLVRPRLLDLAFAGVRLNLTRLHVLLRKDAKKSLIPDDEVQRLAHALPTDDPLADCYVLLAAHQAGLLPPAEYTRMALRTISRLDASSRITALDLVDEVLQFSTPELKFDHMSDGGLQILKPLLYHTIRPDIKHLLGPASPIDQYLKATTTLRPSAKDHPLLPDWIFSPLDALLDSSGSAALAQAPQNWCPAEVDIVRATLSLAQFADLNDAEITFAVMRVFMLEHGDPQAVLPDSNVEIFRDERVASLLIALFSRFDKSPRAVVALEGVAKRSLGRISFYDFFSDLVALYEAISYGHPLFASLVLICQSSDLPSDYRKVVWCEHPSALRSIHISVEEIPVESGSLYYPPEGDAEVLHGYVTTLQRGWVRLGQGAVWELVVWHVACAMWGSSGVGTDVRKMVMAGWLRCGADAIAAVVKRSVQAADGDSVDAEELTKRKEAVKSTLGEGASARLGSFGI